jgi:hypothetical protein
MPSKPTPAAPATRNDELKGQSLLVRSVAATLDIKVPGPSDVKFRATLLRRAAADLAGMPSGLLIRFFESACSCDFPDPDVVGFRVACERALAPHLDLSAYKSQTAKP